jgi:paraquat-inducible protein A
MTEFPPESAAAHGIAVCHTCHKLSPASAHKCSRCGAAVHLRQTDSLHRTIALVATSSVLYIPANVLPIMTTNQLGQAIDSTILGGVVLLWHHGSYPVAAVIFIASVVVPLGKLVALILLCWSVGRGKLETVRERTVAYRVTEFVGRWSMIDVFTIGLLVAMVQLGFLATVEAGVGAVYFAVVVVLTMLASQTFDPRLLWETEASR